MMCNLFHSFDPYMTIMTIHFPMKWMVIATLIFSANWQLFFSLSSIELIHKKLISTMWELFKSLIKQLEKAFLTLFSLITFIYFMNVIGLIPFVFTYTSHLSTNLSFSLSLWLSGIILSIFISFNKFMSHLVPTGTPTILWMFLVLIESISQLIRPITLAIRLMANVMAGHLIMNLLGNFISLNPFLSMFTLIQSSFIIFEYCIAIVQAYVFVSLLALYWNEC